MPVLPPGPSFPLIQTARLVVDPFKYHRELRRKYGDPYTIPALNGTVVCTGDPEGVREIFSADPDTFTPWAPEVLRPMVGDESVVLLTGERHKRERKLLAPPFYGERMRAYGEMMRAVARRQIARRGGGDVFKFLDAAQAISLEIIIRAVYGVDDEANVDRMASAVMRFVKAAHPALFFTKLLQRDFFGFGPWARLQKYRAEWDVQLYEHIRARRDGPKGEDILSMLVHATYDDGTRMSDEQVRSELVILLFAGHETTALAISWAIYWLLRDPARLEKLRAEIDACASDDADAIARLPYLGAVCDEALRIHPIIADPLRTVAKPFRFMGYDVPVGHGVCAVAGLVHEDPSIYPEPFAFRPERFLERTFKPWEYFPFGGGARRCIGAPFAHFEMKLVLATILAENELELREPNEVRPARRNVTMGPKTGVRVRRRGARQAFKFSIASR